MSATSRHRPASQCTWLDLLHRIVYGLAASHNDGAVLELCAIFAMMKPKLPEPSSVFDAGVGDNHEHATLVLVAPVPAHSHRPSANRHLQLDAWVRMNSQFELLKPR